jgi:putative protein-disulfide isomerase
MATARTARHPDPLHEIDPMTEPLLHYIHDPLCGWCYGAAPLLRAARDVVAVQAHGGGMMTGANRQRVTPRLRDYVMPHDQRISALTGQPFGAAYFDGLLRDETAVFDSAPPTAAMLAADTVAGRGLDLLARLQRAHYMEGRRIADAAVLIEMAADIGLDRVAFAAALEASSGAQTEAHIAESRAFLARVGGAGFPTFALEVGGALTTVDVGAYLGRPDAFAAWLRDAQPQR